MAYLIGGLHFNPITSNANCPFLPIHSIKRKIPIKDNKTRILRFAPKNSEPFIVNKEAEKIPPI